MKPFLIAIVLTLFTISVFGQEPVVSSGSEAGSSLRELLLELEKEADLKIYYRLEWIENTRIQAPEKGKDLETTLAVLLKGTGLNFYREAGGIYLYPGTPISLELPRYQKYIAEKPAQQTATDRASGSSDLYLQTNNLSEEKFLTVGRPGILPPGKKCRVRGKIINLKTEDVLIGATLYVRELELGTITDVEGEFEFSLKPGEYTLSVDHMAMKAMEYGLKVLSDGEINLALENEFIELEEVTVSDQRHSNVQGIMMGYERISTKAMKEIPVVLGERDVLKVAQMLPGVQNAGEGTSGFNVRGGSADQNMFYLNKISIYNTSHLFGFFTAFSPDIISDFSLYKNNIPSKYGGRIASIFDINTRPGNKDHFFAQGGISPITGHFSVEGPIVKEKVSFVGSLRSTYSDWLLKRINDQEIRESTASFYDVTFGITADPNLNNQIKAFVYMSSDKFALSDKNDYSYANSGASLSWKHSFSSSFSSDLSVSTSKYQFETIDKNNVTEAYSHEYYVKHTEGRADFLWMPSGNHRIEFGLSGIYYDLDRGDILPYGVESTRIPISLGMEQGIESALYVSDEFRIFPRLNLLLGLRYSYFAQVGPTTVHLYEPGLPKNRFTLLEETKDYEAGEVVKSYSGFEPRAALNLQLGQNSSLKASYNRLRQYIFLLSNTFALAPSDQWKLTDYYIAPPVSDQVSLGFYKDFKGPGLSLSLEVYKKWVNQVVEYKDGADFISADPIETQVLQGTQDADGIELMIKKNTNRLTGWMSYTYSRSTILINGAFDEETVNGGMPYPSNFDRPNSFNLVGNYRLSRRLSVSSNIVYSTGRPVTLPVSAYYSEGNQYLLYSTRNKYRIPDYFRVDLSINLEGNLKFKKFAHSYWMLNIYNMTGRQNAYSVFYEVEDGQIKGYKLSIFARPIVTLSWNFKFGNYNSD